MSSKLLSRRRRPKNSSVSSTDGAVGSDTVSSPSVASADSPPSDASNTNASPSTDSGSVPPSVSEAFEQVHPSLVEYLSMHPQNSTLAVVEPSQQIFPPLSPTSPSSNGPSSMTMPQTPSGMSPHQPIMVPANYHNLTNSIPPLATFPQFFGNGAFAPLPAVSTTNAHMFTHPHAHPGVNGIDAISPSSQHLSSYMGGDGSGGGFSSWSEMGLTEEVLMSDHWMNLMRQTGIFDNSMFSAPGTADTPASATSANGQTVANGAESVFVGPNAMF
jgi:hypothetical protein